MDDLSSEPEAPQEPPNLTLLRRLVTALTAVMIVGLVVVVGLIVMRFSQDRSGPPLPDTLELPDGAEASAVTAGDGWYAVVTKDNRILIFDALTGALRQTVEVRSD